MTNLLESGIDNQIIEEVKNALLEQENEQVNEITMKQRSLFVSKGYTESEITTTSKLYSYDNKVYLKIESRVPDGTSCDNNTHGVAYLSTSASNLKALNVVISKIIDFYNERTNSEIKEINDRIMSLTLKNAKFYTDYNIPKLSEKGIGSAVSYYYNALFNGSNAKVEGDVLAKIDKLVAEYQQQSELKKQEEEQLKEAKKQGLRTWALENGSELLKARIEESMNWVELAEKEHDRSRMPEGFDYKDEDDYDSCWDYKNPTLEHISALREARKNEVFESVEMRKCRKTDEDGDKTFYYFIVATMTGYDGVEFEVSKLIDEEFVSVEE